MKKNSLLQSKIGLRNPLYAEGIYPAGFYNPNPKAEPNLPFTLPQFAHLKRNLKIYAAGIYPEGSTPQASTISTPKPN